MNPDEFEQQTNAQREYNHIQFWFDSAVFKYQENPVLLDKILPQFLTAAFDKIQRFKMDAAGNFVNGPGYLQVCRYIAKLMHIRGRKKIDKYFPHEVPHLRIILSHMKAIEAEELKIKKQYEGQNYTRETSPEFLSSALNDAHIVLIWV